MWNGRFQTVISELTAATATFKNRLKFSLCSRALLQ